MEITYKLTLRPVGTRSDLLVLVIVSNSEGLKKSRAIQVASGIASPDQVHSVFWGEAVQSQISRIARELIASTSAKPVQAKKVELHQTAAPAPKPKQSTIAELYHGAPPVGRTPLTQAAPGSYIDNGTLSPEKGMRFPKNEELVKTWQTFKSAQKRASKVSQMLGIGMPEVYAELARVGGTQTSHLHTVSDTQFYAMLKNVLQERSAGVDAAVRK